MLNRIKQAFHVLMGDIDIDLMESSHRAQWDALNEYCENLEKKYNQVCQDLSAVQDDARDFESFTEVTAPSNKAWGRVLRQLVWSKVQNTKPTDDDGLIYAITDGCDKYVSKNALAQCISYLRTKKGYNIKRKNNRYTL